MCVREINAVCVGIHVDDVSCFGSIENCFVSVVAVPEIAVLRFEVWEDDRVNPDDFVGQSCMPVTDILQGIRVVPLHSRKGEEISSKLLCQFKLEDLHVVIGPRKTEETVAPQVPETPEVTEVTEATEAS